MSIIQFLKASLAYFLFAILLTFLAHESALERIIETIRFLGVATPLFLVFVFGLTCIGLAVNAITRNNTPREIIIASTIAFMATLYFQVGFSIIKTSMPFIVPFYADPAFAKIDNLLHFGTDPWIFVHRWGDVLPIDLLAALYVKGWLLVALLFPVFLVAFDTDKARVRRFFILYFAAWVLVGNMLALIGNSAGPIYFDRLIGDDQFDGLIASLSQDGRGTQAIRNIQENLWIEFAHNNQNGGSGISAFPSVHLSVATLAGLYAIERSRYLLPISIAFVAAILFMSVYSGYHYAIDGYVSIIVMGVIWFVLHRRERKSGEIPI